MAFTLVLVVVVVSAGVSGSELDLMYVTMLEKVSNSYTAVKFSPGSVLLVRWDLAWGVVMIGRSLLSESSTLLSK